jgi:hypothetical protein
LVVVEAGFAYAFAGVEVGWGAAIDFGVPGAKAPN